MKVALCGYSGKCGSKVYEALKEKGHEVIGIDENSISLIRVIQSVDIVIDFTVKNVSLKHIMLCIDYRKPFIVGTTGFTYDELALIKSLCNKNNVNGIICYNFSLPLNVIIKQIKTLSYYYHDIEYVDIHHVSKVDKVSGTTYLFLLQNKLIKVKSLKNKSNIVTYVIKMKSDNDEMMFTYKVKDKKVFALGVLQCLDDIHTKNIINLIR